MEEGGMGQDVQQNTNAGAGSSRGGSSALNKAVGVTVAIIVIGGLAAAYFMLLENTGSITKQSGTTSVITNTTVANSILSQNISNGGGPGQNFLSRNETSVLIRTSGLYSAYHNTTPGQLPGPLANNVTSYWAVSDQAQNSTPRPMYEYVYSTQKAKTLYGLELPAFLQTPQNITAKGVNLTAGGLTYSYIKYYVSSTRQGGELLGYKDTDLAIIIYPYGVNQTAVASLVANDIP